MELSDVIKTRRSIRKYKPLPVPDEDITHILNAARLAPSWGNKQCWRFIIVKDPETKKAISEDRDWIANAPVVIVACANPKLSGNKADQPYYMLDIGICMEHLVMAAWDKGLGTCWVGWFTEDVLKRTLDVPDTMRVVAFTPVGYPDEEKGEVSDRLKLADICFKDRYGKE